MSIAECSFFRDVTGLMDGHVKEGMPIMHAVRDPESSTEG